jgi:hypothetical protein
MGAEEEHNRLDAYLQGWKLRPNREGRSSALQPLYTETLQSQGLGPGNMKKENLKDYMLTCKDGNPGPNREGRSSGPQPLYTGTLKSQGLGPGNMQIGGPKILDAYLQRWKPRAQ